VSTKSTKSVSKLPWMVPALDCGCSVY